MVQFDCLHWFCIRDAVNRWKTVCETQSERSKRASLMDEPERLDLERDLHRAREQCKHLKLGRLDSAICTILSRLNQPAKCNHEALATELAALGKAIHAECMPVQFAFIAQDKSEFFEREALFGPTVRKAFPQLSQEIKDAGNSMAAGLHTGAVQHLMRVMEFGLRLLYQRLLRKKPSNPNWKTMLDQIEKEIKRRDQLNAPSWKRQRAFFAEAAAHFSFFRDIRNRSVHVNLAFGEYVSPGEEDALRIFEQVRHFTQHLATKLSAA